MSSHRRAYNLDVRSRQTEYYKNMENFTISQIANRSGLTPRAIRLYERHGLISEAARNESGYRTYDDYDIKVLRFIHLARELDLSLDEIKRILDLQHAGETPCATVLDLVEGHIRDIDCKMRSLQELRSTLDRARNQANDSRVHGKDAVVCRIIETSQL